jgi:hypothetical protein
MPGIHVLTARRQERRGWPGQAAALKDRAPGQPNPFVVGPDAVQRFLTVLGECALATKASIGEDTPGR